MRGISDDDARPRISAAYSRGGVGASATDKLLPAAIWLAIGGQVWNSILGTSTIALIGTYNFTIAEVSLVASGLAVATGWLRYGLRSNVLALLVLAFAVLTAMNLLRGLMETPASALVMARSTVPFAVLLLISTVRYPEKSVAKPLLDALTLSALVLTAIVFARLIFGPQLFMIGGAGLSVTDINDGGRALPAGGALLLAIAAVAITARAVRGGPRAGRNAALATTIIAALVLTGQGTATIAGLIGLMVVIALERGPALPARLFLTGTVIVLSTILMLTLRELSSEDLENILPGQIFDNIARRDANLGTRELVWQAAWISFLQAPTFVKAFGWPTGASPDLLLQTRSWGWVTWTYSVHSMYFGTLIATGAVGAALYTIILLGAGRLALVTLSSIGNSLALAIFAMLILFGYTYSLPIEQAAILVLCLKAGDDVRNRTDLIRPRTKPAASSTTPSSEGIKPHTRVLS